MSGKMRAIGQGVTAGAFLAASLTGLAMSGATIWQDVTGAQSSDSAAPTLTETGAAYDEAYDYCTETYALTDSACSGWAAVEAAERR